MAKNKTTAKHFEIFKAECEKWIEIFGLKGWSVRILHENISKETVTADCLYRITKRVCDIRLAKEWSVKITDNNVKKDAFHEVCELFLGDLVALAEYRYATEAEIEEQTHAIIRTLENVLWDENYD